MLITAAVLWGRTLQTQSHFNASWIAVLSFQHSLVEAWQLAAWNPTSEEALSAYFPFWFHKKSYYFVKPERKREEKLTSPVGHTCFGLWDKEMEDCHDHCVHCLDLDHACIASQARALAFSHTCSATLFGLARASPVATRTAASTTQHITSTLVGQEQLDLVRPMLDASDVGETDILGSDSEREDLALAPVCVEARQVEEEQEQPHSLYHQLISRIAQALEIEMPAEQGQRPANLMMKRQASPACLLRQPMVSSAIWARCK